MVFTVVFWWIHRHVSMCFIPCLCIFGIFICIILHSLLFWGYYIAIVILLWFGSCFCYLKYQTVSHSECDGQWIKMFCNIWIIVFIYLLQFIMDVKLFKLLQIHYLSNLIDSASSKTSKWTETPIWPNMSSSLEIHKLEVHHSGVYAPSLGPGHLLVCYQLGGAGFR